MTTPIDSVPKDIVLEIFSLLDVFQVGRCSKVCKRWQAILIQENFLWHPIFWKPFFQKYVKDWQPSGALTTEYFKEHIINNISTFHDSVAKFVSSLKRNEIGNFICICPFSKPSDQVLFRIDYSIGKAHVKIVEEYYFLGNSSFSSLFFSNKSSGRIYDIKQSQEYCPCKAQLYHYVPLKLISGSDKNPTDDQIEEFKKRVLILPLEEKSKVEQATILQKRKADLVSVGRITRSMAKRRKGS